MRGEVVHSILEETPERVLARIDETPSAAGLVEIRADLLRAGDLGGIVARAPRRIIVAVRDRADGGRFSGSVEEKRALLRSALDAGAAFVDVEHGGPVAELADGPDAARTILSHHGARSLLPELTALYDAMAGSRAARLKIVPAATALTDLGAIADLLRRARADARPLAAFATGDAGIPSRIFALAWGSWGTYGAAAPGRETASGQLTSDALLHVHRVLALSPSTRRFGIAGANAAASLSPALHAAAYRALGIDAVYVPLPTGDAGDLASAADERSPLRLDGFGVTIPLKEAVAARCARLHGDAASGAVNTVRAEGAWHGYNTDAPAALELIRRRITLRGTRVAVAGAGGTARAIGAVLVRQGAVVTLYHRSERGAETAAAIGAAAAPWGRLAGAPWDVLVQATPLGAAGEEVVPPRSLVGRMVLDAAYGPRETPLVRAARARGLAVADGLDLLAAQAARQCAILTGLDVGAAVFAAAAAPYRTHGSA
ncbi:MAG TPA: type I 3-dehydroquinate dehydratase [Candidatus Polarisedimenticolaceae bacterium]|nr:type I 3-dehydroquinate dehydratase [Candidatus Polarisedimenticolaceae bacterium]